MQHEFTKSGSIAQYTALHTSQDSIKHYKNQPWYAHSRGNLSTGFEVWILTQTVVYITIELDPTS